MKKQLKTTPLQLNEWEKLKSSEEVQFFRFIGGFEESFIEAEQVEALWLEETLIGLAFICPNEESDYENRIKNFCWEMYGEGNSLELIEYLETKFPIYQTGALIEYLAIHEKYQGLGYGTWWVDQLKQHYSSLLLYAEVGTESFWEHQGFDSLVLDYLAYSPTTSF